MAKAPKLNDKQLAALFSLLAGPRRIDGRTFEALRRRNLAGWAIDYATHCRAERLGVDVTQVCEHVITDAGLKVAAHYANTPRGTVRARVLLEKWNRLKETHH